MCCSFNCRQGRDCPKRAMWAMRRVPIQAIQPSAAEGKPTASPEAADKPITTPEQAMRWAPTWLLVIGVALVLTLILVFSARTT